MNEWDNGPDETGSLDSLLAAAKSGSEVARNELFSKLQKYLSWVAQQHFNPALTAKAGISDVVQDSLLHANEEFASFRGTTAEQFRGWIRQIVINEVRSFNRHFAAKRRNAGQERAISSGQSSESFQVDLADGAQTPSHEIMNGEDAHRVQGILGKLPADMRQVIHLRNWERMQFNEIAMQMGISLSQAAKLWYNALIELQRLHSKQEHE